MSKGNKPNKISITELLATNSTKPSLALIHRHGKKARNHAELQIQLAELYGESPDKIEIEKEFANLHPHREFILRHCAPEPEQIVLEENMSNACGCGYSGADGSSDKRSAAPSQRAKATELVLAMGFGILIGAAVFGIAAKSMRA